MSRLSCDHITRSLYSTAHNTKSPHLDLDVFTEHGKSSRKNDGCSAPGELLERRTIGVRLEAPMGRVVRLKSARQGEGPGGRAILGVRVAVSGVARLLLARPRWREGVSGMGQRRSPTSVRTGTVERGEASSASSSRTG